MTRKGMAVAAGGSTAVATGVGVAVVQSKEVKVESPKPIVFKEEKADTYFLLKNDAANAVSKLKDDAERNKLVNEIRTNPTRDRLNQIIKKSKEEAVSLVTDSEFSWKPTPCCGTRNNPGKWGKGMTMTPLPNAPKNEEFEELMKKSGKATLKSYKEVYDAIVTPPKKEKLNVGSITNKPSRWKPESERPKPKWPREDYVLRKNAAGELELIKRTW